jgi:hypothetical protein
MTDEPRKDERSDIQQAVEARSDAIARGEGGNGKSPLDSPGTGGGVGGTGGDTKNQNDDQQ